MKLKFRGFDNPVATLEKDIFTCSSGEFTVGEIYTVEKKNIDFYGSNHIHEIDPIKESYPDGQIEDDDGIPCWVDLIFFDEVKEN